VNETYAKSLAQAGLGAGSALSGSAIGAQLSPPLADDIRATLDTMHELATVVMDASDRLHGPRKVEAGEVCDPSMTMGWAEDMRASALHAQRRGRNAVQELHRIRQTLGL
jgi:hypothetical protein